VSIAAPPRRNTRYETVDASAAASSTELSAQAALELANFAASQRAAADAPLPPSAGPRPRCSLILVRHGFSAWNEENRFTGWADPPLTSRGREEVGVNRIERVYCSVHERAIKTAWLLLDEMELQWVPLTYDWRLNERHYGALTGRNKRECSDEFGLAQVQRWRRSVHETPPPIESEASAALMDSRYHGVPVPSAESLSDCAERLRPFVRGALTGAMRKAIDECGVVSAREGEAVEVPTFVISSSENVLRALMMELEGLSDLEVPLVDVPHATPLVYRFDASLQPIPSTLAQAPLRMGWYMADPQRVTAEQKRIRDEVDCRLDAQPCREPNEEECYVLQEAGAEDRSRQAVSWRCQ